MSSPLWVAVVVDSSPPVETVIESPTPWVVVVALSLGHGVSAALSPP